jgi:spermidine/putrescine transport system permease protein
MTDRLISWALRTYVTIAFSFIFLPIIVLVVFSFDIDRYPTLVWNGVGLIWYREALNDPDIVAAFVNSVTVSLSVAILSTFLGSTAAYFVNRWDFPGKGIYLALAMLPPCLPLVVLGLALLIFLRQIHLAGTLLSVVLAQVVLCSAFAMAIVRLRLSQLDPTLEQVSWNLGCGEWQTVSRVVLPQAAPTIGAALLLTMAISFDEFIIAWFVSGMDVTLPVKLYAMLHGDVSPKINAVGSLVFAVSIALVALAQILWTSRPNRRGMLAAPDAR